MPLARIAAACWTKPGRCFAEQVGVKAPGTANSTTFRPAKSWSVVIPSMPPAPATWSVPPGSFSPTWIAIVSSSARQLTPDPAA